MSYSTAARVTPRPNTRPMARTAAPPRLRVVAPRTGRSRAGLAVLCIAMLITGLLALLLLNISLSNGAYELTSLRKTQVQASEQQQALAEKVDGLSAPQELVKSATALGMVPAPNTAFVRLPDGRIVGKAAKALPPPNPPEPKITSGLGDAAASAGAAAAYASTGTTTTVKPKTAAAAMTGAAKTGTEKTKNAAGTTPRR